MLNAKAFANAAGTIMAIWVIVCVLLSYLVPDLLFAAAQSWMHTINLDVVKTSFSPELGSIVLGFVSATGLTWVTTYALIETYNRLAKK